MEYEVELLIRIVSTFFAILSIIKDWNNALTVALVGVAILVYAYFAFVDGFNEGALYVLDGDYEEDEK